MQQTDCVGILFSDIPYPVPYNAVVRKNFRKIIIGTEQKNKTNLKDCPTSPLNLAPRGSSVKVP
jgi:hypothetical protein